MIKRLGTICPETGTQQGTTVDKSTFINAIVGKKGPVYLNTNMYFHIGSDKFTMNSKELLDAGTVKIGHSGVKITMEQIRSAFQRVQQIAFTLKDHKFNIKGFNIKGYHEVNPFDLWESVVTRTIPIRCGQVWWEIYWES